MKKLLLTTSVVLTMGATLFAQNGVLSNRGKHVSVPVKTPHRHSQEKNMSCGNDTILYTLLKEEALGTSTYGPEFMYAGAATLTGYSQSFYNTGGITVHGISFFGGVVDAMNPNQTVNATAVLMNADAFGRPTTVIATKPIQMDTSFTFRTAMFITPQAVTGNYAVAIRNNSPSDTIAIVTNDATVLTYSENLAYLNVPILGGWVRADSLYALAGGTNGEAFEAIIAPVITYNLATDFTVTPNPVCVGQAISLTNTTGPVDIIENSMYSYYAFNYQWGLTPDSTYLWSLGDGSPIQWVHDVPSYTYASPGTDTVTLVTLGGFFTSCVDTKQVVVTVTGTAISNYTIDATNSPVISFINTSADATSYSWNFGDGSPLDTSPNPTHTYTSNGNFTVVLTATNSCNSSTNSQTVNIATVGIADLNTSGISIYPNPSATGMFEISAGNADKKVVTVFNIVGEQLMEKEFSSSRSVIDLSNYTAGLYFVSIVSDNKKIVKQVTITR